MNILFIGDIVGKTGRSAVFARLPLLKSQYSIDLTIANGENVAHGKGITQKLYQEMLSNGIDIVTLGNHAFSKSDIMDFIQDSKQLVRPVNLMPTEHGQGYVDIKVKGLPVRIINLCGSVFMENIYESPFICMQDLKESSKGKIVIVDFHAEATSEKIAFTHMYKDVCTAVLGTHTHVQTADERLIGGCAFISDVGMSGPYDSVIGRDIQEVLNRFTGVISRQFTVAEGPAVICGVVVRVNETTLRAESIERFQIRPENS